MHIAGWKNNTQVVVVETQKFPNPWGSEPKLCVVDEHFKILSEYLFPETRIVFKLIPFLDKNLVVVVRYNYTDNVPTLIIDHVQINNESTYELTVTRKHAISTPYRCNNVNGKVCKLSDASFSVVCGDFGNYEDCDFYLFTLEGYLKLNNIKIFNEIVSNFYINESFILTSDVLADKKCRLHIKLLNQCTNEVFFLKHDFPLTSCEHKYTKPSRVDSKILEYPMIYEERLCLVEVKLVRAPDVLHNEEFTVYLLLNITTNTMVCVSRQFTRAQDVLPYIQEDGKSLWCPPNDDQIVVKKKSSC